MKKIFKKNQVVISALAIMIAVAGYLTYAGKGDIPSATTGGNSTYSDGVLGDISDEDILAENQALNEAKGTTAAGEQGTTGATDVTGTATDPTGEVKGESQAADANENDDILAVDDDGPDAAASPGDAVLTSGQTVADFLAQSKLNRENVRGKNKEDLLSIINNEALSQEERQGAIDTMLALTTNADKENATETLLNAKGFQNTFVSIVDGKVDVVIGKGEITDAERAQVEDIVKSKTEIGVENIEIALMELQK